ncbi:hypothetical protein CI102_710 [Trichoderma harzianum]|uniref:Uncharacterized protein n=1 Tax=Trichoderma harzianum CBS 226.95 TaxID=983964 RepID=A0A2T4AID5_TRIHA|nr:hypothetical protein M431DRAFT_80131 [Trichoderma harzianum CBS 226.95]PKK54380.1 hypothetical protein CI102_710 [Trichoderma harzianum]PTB56831.1 hypothetical protein M431DRAFT_80131 [Trichoderma harzianum CBS 226.95]
MGQDPPRRPSQQGFHNTFGQGRSIKRDSIQGDGQRSSGDTAPNAKRIRTVDRPDERSPVDQRDHLEGSSPTTLVSHRQRHPDTPKQHPSSQLSKPLTNHVSGISFKPVLDLIFDRFFWCKLKSEAKKSHNRAIQSQAHSHYHPSDYGSSPEFIAAQQKQNLDDMKRADKHVGELDEQIASAMQPLIRHISEAWGKSSDGSNASEEREASEAKINTIQTTMKKEMEESFKKEVAESQQFIKELVGSQMAKLKEALAQENEQKLHALQKTLAQEGEDRATSLRETLIQENEKRIAEMKESINREHKAKIAALENALADEAKNKDRIAALEQNSLREALSEQRRLSESSINKAQLAQQLQQLSLSQDDKFSKHEARVNDHSTIIKRLEEQLCDHSKLITENKPQKDAATRLDKLESTISNFSAEWEEMKKRVEKLSSIRSASVPDNKILDVIKPEVDKLDKNIRENIAKIQGKLQPFLVQESLKRETLEEQFGNITRQVSGIEKEHAIIKADCSEIREQVNNQNQLNTLEGSRFDEKLDRRTSMLMDKFRSQMEGVYIQVQSLNAWQTNFNTAGLYGNIISHINKTIPEGPGTAPQIVALKQQLNGIEARLAAWENASNKRRKLPGGNVKVVNGRQIDAQ